MIKIYLKRLIKFFIWRIKFHTHSKFTTKLIKMKKKFLLINENKVLCAVVPILKLPILEKNIK